MAKRRQTTGLPKTERKTGPSAKEGAGKPDAPKIRLKQEFKTHGEREAAIQRMVLLGVGAAVLIVVLVLAIAFVVDTFIVPSRTVATVNGTSISVGDYEDRIRLERMISTERINGEINNLIELGFSFDDAGNQILQFEPYATLWTELNTSEQMGLRVLNDMISDVLVREHAEARGITVTQEEIDHQIREAFSFNPELFLDFEPETTPEVEPTATPTPLVSATPSPTATEEPEEEAVVGDEPADNGETDLVPTLTPFPTIAPIPTRSLEERESSFESYLDDFFTRARRDAAASREDVNAYFELKALRTALSEAVVETSTTGLWVNARHILVDTEEEALDIIDALNNGESFASLAQAVSTDTGSGAMGGELDWQAVDNYVEPFADAVREAPLGQIIGPVQSDFGYHIIQVRAREDRELTEAQIERNRQEEFRQWLNDQRNLETNEIEISDIWPDHVPTNPPFIYRER